MSKQSRERARRRRARNRKTKQNNTKQEKMVNTRQSDTVKSDLAIYIEIDWTFPNDSVDFYGYSSLTGYFEKLAVEKNDAGEERQEKILRLLAGATSMTLSPSSVNEPFSPIFRDFHRGHRSTIAEDFSDEELNLFVEIVDILEEPWLKARLSDLLWIRLVPREAKYPRLAIDAYISLGVHEKTWRRGVEECWDRAISLSLQLRDFDKIDSIKENLMTSFRSEFSASPFMHLWLAQLLDKHKLDEDFTEEISEKLASMGNSFFESSNLLYSRDYLELAFKKYSRNKDSDEWLKCLIKIAESYEQEAESRAGSSQMVANSFYENAIQAYRRVPVKYRDENNVDEKIRDIRTKISETGKAGLGEMVPFELPSVDLSKQAKASVEHVTGKKNVAVALVFFCGLFPGANLEDLKESAGNQDEGFFSSIFSSRHFSPDGRVIAKNPGANPGTSEDHPDNQATLNQKIQKQFSILYSMAVQGSILPALRVLLMEYRFTQPLLESLCSQSPIVPRGREKLMAYALWLGFEYDFANAVHLLSPQFENIIRTKLKDAGISTTNIDTEGIENENGLSSLIDMPESSSLLGENLVFEIKSIFTDPLGPNLRNEVAHGLLDYSAASSAGSVYGWWMILRLIMHSLPFREEAKSEQENDGCE